jgi:hypothetical protein
MVLVLHFSIFFLDNYVCNVVSFCVGQESPGKLEKTMLGTKNRAVQQPVATTPEPQESKIIITLSGAEAEKFAEAKARLEEEIGFRLHNHQAMTKILQTLVLN